MGKNSLIGNQNGKELPFLTLLLMISFASVNAVLFTPSLPNIARFFAITEDVAQRTVLWFLVGYTVGQLMYGPMSNRYGRKPALYFGIILQIASSLLCIFAGYSHQFALLVIGRFLLALGSGAGLKMTFTLVNDFHEPMEASRKISYLTLAFAITPGLSIALGGFLNAHYGWISCFYACAIYGLILLILSTQIPESKKVLDYHAFEFRHLWDAYKVEFRKVPLILNALLMGTGSCFVYSFASIAPFIAIDLIGMNSIQYGVANILPSVGMIFGSLLSARRAEQHHSLASTIKKGIIVTGIGTVLLILCNITPSRALFSLFIPVTIVNFGIALVLPNASTLAMSNASDKAHGSAVLNFVNMGLATLVVFGIGLFPMTYHLLPSFYAVQWIGSLFLFLLVSQSQ